MSGERIFVVEDNQIVSKDIQKRLERLGYELAGSAASGRAAIDGAVQLKPDLILMDIRLKGRMDGIEAAGEIQARTYTPIVYLTAHADDETLSRAKRTQPHGYVVKPFEENALRTAIEIGLAKAGMERTLRESERWLRTTLRSIAEATIATDGAGNVRLLNPAAEALTGWVEADATGRYWRDIVELLDPETGGLIRDPVELALREARAIELDRVLLVDNRGSELAIELKAAPIVDDDDGSQGLVLILRDVSEQDITLRALRRQHDLLNAVVESAGDGLYLSSLGGRFLLMNAAGARLLSTTALEALGRSDEELLPPVLTPLWKEARERALATHVAQSFECSLSPEGVGRAFLFSAAPCDAGGETLGVVYLARDVSALGRGGEEARALTGVVGRLAHELAQSLAALDDALPRDPEAMATAGPDDVEAARGRLRAVAGELDSLHRRAGGSRTDG